jgi:molecular chaperone GrpE
VVDEVQTRLEELWGEVRKLAREQFQAVSLLEGQNAAIEELAEVVREQGEASERQTTTWGQALDELQQRARLDLVKDLLPLSDALDASLRAAFELPAEPRRVAPQVPSWRTRLNDRLNPAPPTAAERPRVAPEGWLHGVHLAQQRLLGLLEREDVRPIPAVGRPFDPHLHLAVGTEPGDGQPDGTIVREELRGYVVRNRVLRHAEVVVARGQNADHPRTLNAADGGPMVGDEDLTARRL